jgi:hypothetical protein
MSSWSGGAYTLTLTVDAGGGRLEVMLDHVLVTDKAAASQGGGLANTCWRRAGRVLSRWGG